MQSCLLLYIAFFAEYEASMLRAVNEQRWRMERGKSNPKWSTELVHARGTFAHSELLLWISGRPVDRTFNAPLPCARRSIAHTGGDKMKS